MSEESKEIRLFDDSVIKLTIKQGLESERFPVTEIKKGGVFTYNNTNLSITAYEDINSVSGALTTGELGYTRDTNRLFVGNISEQLKGEQQQTLGGTLSGNKYLGYFDSRSANASTNSEANAKPIPITDLLTGNSDTNYRSYNFTTDDNKVFPTEDGKWARIPHYNKNYDAYDGDYMYDIYRNALILFDHNIRPKDNKDKIEEPDGTNFTVGGKRKTPLIPRFDDITDSNKTPAQKTVYNFTKDMYGEGYVLFYNIIPDGETLTFENKGFTATNEYYNPDDSDKNYSYNIIKINKVPSSAIIDCLDQTYFENSEAGGLISLKKDFRDKLDTAISVTYSDSTQSRLIVNDGTKLKQSDISTQKIKNITTGFTSNSFTEGVNNVVSSKGYATISYVNDVIGGLSSGSGSSGSIKLNGLPDNVMDWTSAMTLSDASTNEAGITFGTGKLTITPGYHTYSGSEDKQQSPTSNYYLLLKITSGNLAISIISGKFDETNKTWAEEKDDDNTTISNSITINTPGTGYLTLSFANSDKVTITGTGLSGYYIPIK